MLDANKILDEAQKITGLSYLGNPLFAEGFNQLIYSINHEADLNEIGIQAQHQQIHNQNDVLKRAWWHDANSKLILVLVVKFSTQE